MKGLNTFTNSEILALKKLIAEKEIATPDKQKGIRGKIRKIGFYFSDFSSRKDGYSVADFEELISLKKIKISDSSYRIEPNSTNKTIEKNTTVEKKNSSDSKSLKSILETFKKIALTLQ